MKDVSTAGVLQTYSDILRAEGMVGFQHVLLSDGVYSRDKGNHIQIYPGAIDRDPIRWSRPMGPLHCCVPFSRHGHRSLAQRH